MSDRIQYEIQVLDKFSANLKKFDDLIAKTRKSLKSFNSSFTTSSKNFAIFQKNTKSNVSHLDILHRSLNKTGAAADIFSRKLSKLNNINLGGAISQLNRLSTAMNKSSIGGFERYSGTTTRRTKKPNFIIGGESYGGFHGVSADLFRYQKSMRNALVPFNNPFIMRGGSASGAYNVRSYMPNFTMPIDSSYRMTGGSSAVVPYGYGRVGGVPSRMYPMRDVTPEMKGVMPQYVNERNNPALQPAQSSQQPRSPVFGGSGLGSFGGMAKAMGYYEAINIGMQVPRNIYNNLKMTRGIEASFDAYKKLGIVSDLGLPKKEMQDVMGIADKYGVKFQDLIDPYRHMLATKGLDTPTTKKLLGGVAAYSNIVGMGSEAQKATYRALEQMLTQQQIRGQEFNLQLQQAPGFRQKFYKAFLKAVKTQGIPSLKADVTEENVGEKFAEYREKGLLESSIVIKHLADILNDPLLQKMGIKKGHMVQGEENRLSNAYFRATTSVGNVVEMPIIKSLIGIANAFDRLGKEIESFGNSLSTWSDWLDTKKQEPTIMKGFIGGAVDAAKFGVDSVLSLPKNLVRAGKDIGMTSIMAGEGVFTGDWSNYNKYAKERNSYWFNGVDLDDSAAISALKGINTDDYLTNGGLKYSRIPKSSQLSQEQVIKVILEGKNMPANMTATVENYGANTTKMRVESNIGGY